MSTVSFRKVKVADDAKPLVDAALQRAGTEGATKVQEVLARAAGQNKDKFLTATEAKAVVDAFERVAAGAAGPLTGATLAAALQQADEAVGRMSSASNVDGVSAHFTFNEKLSAKLVTELHDSVAKAAGRRLDINVMIFEFQSDEIETALLDIAKNNPNVTIRIIADSGQESDYGGNALPSILKKKLSNIQVKYKKDFPYSWDATNHRPKYNHGSTQGLLHHKGFATFIDGAPEKLVAGSFNWSNTADKQNYEDLTVFRNKDSSGRRVVGQWGDEFAAFFNNGDACLSPNNFSNFKKDKWNEMLVANGSRPLPTSRLPDDSPTAYVPPPDTRSFDVNGYRAVDKERLVALVGNDVAKAMVASRKSHGRFDSLEDLKARVPGVANLPAETQKTLVEAGTFGSGLVSVNTASLEELDAVGFSAADAKAIVAHREANGDFESLEDLKTVPGVTYRDLNLVKGKLSAVDVEAFFNSRPFGSPAAGTGYGTAGSTTSALMGEGGVVAPTPAGVSAAANDLFHRAKPGQTIQVAMYGMSATSKEFKALAAAAQRGVTVRVVLNDAFTASTVAALKALRTQGFPIDVRVQTAKTMHEKFGVVGDDVFAGSANFSESSSTKHSENRFVVKNDVELANQFAARFNDMWEKSRTV